MGFMKRHQIFGCLSFIALASASLNAVGATPTASPDFQQGTRETLGYIDVLLAEHQKHLMTVARRNGNSQEVKTRLAKMNLALQLLAEVPGDPNRQANNRQTALRLIEELPPATRVGFQRELKEMKAGGGPLGERAGELLATMGTPKGAPSNPMMSKNDDSSDTIEGILFRLQRLRAARTAACPSDSTLQQWNQTIDSAQVTDGASVVNGKEQVQSKQRDYQKAEQQALAAQTSYQQSLTTAMRNGNIAYLTQSKDRIFHERDQLRRKTEDLLKAILPAPGGQPRNLHDNLAAASSIVPVFSQFQRRAPLWSYSGVDVASNQTPVTPETYASLDNPANQRYFVESLTENREPGFVFTLTDEGKKALSRPSFPIEKIAVHRLGELDASQQRSAALFQEEDQVYQAQKNWEKQNPKLVAAIQNSRQSTEDRNFFLASAQNRLATGESELQKTQGHLKKDSALRTDLSNCRQQTASLDGALRHAKKGALTSEAIDQYTRNYRRLGAKSIAAGTPAPAVGQDHAATTER
jgi:hypothetical protein